MSEDTERTPLATIEAFEAAAFRVSNVARELLAQYPHLPLRKMRLRATAYPHPPGTVAGLEISAGDTDTVRAWADALCTTVKIVFHDGPGAFEYHEATVVISGVGVTVASTRNPTPEEIEAWRAKDAAAAAEGPSGGDQR